MLTRILNLPTHVSRSRLEALVVDLREVGLEVEITEDTLLVRGPALEDTLQLDARLAAVETTGPSPRRVLEPA